MKRPRIAVPVPTSTDYEYNRNCWPEYAEALKMAGADAVEFRTSASAQEQRTSIEFCDGVLLPGSPADVDPSRYGQPRMTACADADRAREELDIVLLEIAYASGRPLLGICFGCQILNVWRGGSLIQDLGIMPVNHAAGRAVAVAHGVYVASDSLLASLLSERDGDPYDSVMDRTPQWSINSSHHQAIDMPGDGLCIVARSAQDGVIEAIEEPRDRGHFVMGLQWHPERDVQTNPASRAIFDRFVSEASRWSLDASWEPASSALLPSAR